jgi:hypothetical protein
VPAVRSPFFLINPETTEPAPCPVPEQAQFQIKGKGNGGMQGITEKHQYLRQFLILCTDNVLYYTLEE